MVVVFVVESALIFPLLRYRIVLTYDYIGRQLVLLTQSLRIDIMLGGPQILVLISY